MSSVATHEVSSEPLDKGKGRAQGPTEHTPLLINTASSSFYDETRTTSPEANNRRLRSKLTSVFLISLSVCITAFVVLALLAWSYAAKVSKVSPEDITRNALVFRGPDRIDVLNTTSTGEIWVRVDARLGLDAGSVVGVNKDTGSDSFLQTVWKAIGRWGVRRMDKVSVTLSTMNIASEHDPAIILASFDTNPMVIPLTANPPTDKSWLTDVSILVRVRATNNTAAIVHFLRHSWRQGSVAIRADVGRVLVRGGGKDETSWRSMFYRELLDVRTSIRVRIPSLPGLPHPGHNMPFPSISDLVTLKSFSVYSEAHNLALRAFATIINPAPPHFNLTSPSFPFLVSLPPASNALSSPPIPVASVTTAPFTLTHPNITLNIYGTVLPLASDSSTTLSSFLSRYLSGQPNPILISSPLIPDVFVDTLFPAPNPRPEILRNVTIHNMKVKPGTPFLASGTVFARVVLPKGMDVELHVSRVLPDVLIFDGEVPQTMSISPPSPPLPDPLPDRAFGHIRPDDWLDALSVRDESQEGEGAAYVVTAKIVDIPLEVLPGRQKEFSNFVSKVVFGSGGAVAGILGSTAVSVGVQGLPFPGEAGEMELGGLPFRGSVRVGKKSMFSDITSWERLKRFFRHDNSHPEGEHAWTLL